MADALSELEQLWKFMVEHGAVRARRGDLELELDPRWLAVRPADAPEPEPAGEEGPTDEDFLYMSSPHYVQILAERRAVAEARAEAKKREDS